MALHHRLLNRVQAAVGFFQAFNGFHRLAIQGGQQLNAAVDGDVVNARASSVQLAHHDHTGAAIALCATFLGAGAVQLFAQVIEDGGGAALTLGFNNFAIEHKTHGVGDLGHGGG